jgi:hypothetical protein
VLLASTVVRGVDHPPCWESTRGPHRRQWSPANPRARPTGKACSLCSHQNQSGAARGSRIRPCGDQTPEAVACLRAWMAARRPAGACLPEVARRGKRVLGRRPCRDPARHNRHDGLQTAMRTACVSPEGRRRGRRRSPASAIPGPRRQTRMQRSWVIAMDRL